jgi:Tol biopolymer transport system component
LSPDGDWIAFASDRDATQDQIDANATSANAGISIYTMRSDGSEVTKIADGARAALLPPYWRHWPQYSPAVSMRGRMEGGSLVDSDRDNPRRFRSEGDGDPEALSMIKV